MNRTVALHEFIEKLYEDFSNCDVVCLQEVPDTFESCMRTGYQVYCEDSPEAATFGRVAVPVEQRRGIHILRVHVSSSVISIVYLSQVQA